MTELDEMRAMALAEYLGVEVDDLEESGYDGCSFEVNPRETKFGKPPSYWAERGWALKRMLADAGSQIETWQALVSLDGNQFRRYNATKELLKSSGLKFEDYGLENNGNDLWHLIADDKYDSWHVYAIRAAFNGEEIEDRRVDSHVNSGEYLVLTDEEADDRATDYIKNSLWAFNAWFLASETELPEQAFAKLSELCDDANDAVLAMVEKTCGLRHLVEAAISADGRAHFINTYDGVETEYCPAIDGEEETFYIYRLN